ncbi:MAG: DUF302 domain-containing protein [Desulfuromonadales bacterium]|nr:DUF302 domain-containing protein [Desulfuromonadales bacterium]
MSTRIYRTESEKSVAQFVAAFGQIAATRGFTIHNEDKMEMAHIFGAHGAEVAESFDLHMVQVCKPVKAARSLEKNPERAVLMPKFVIAFSRDGKTQVRMLKYGNELIAELVDDEEFPGSLEESFATLTTLIDAAI